MQRWMRSVCAALRIGLRPYAKSSRCATLICASGIAFSAGAAAVAASERPRKVVPLHYETNEALQVQTDHKLTKRELRFLQFASVEYDDVIYMTPMDFLDSLTLDTPRERVYRRVLTKKQVQWMLSRTPPYRRGSKSLLRTLDHNGIISYAEYIFLLTLLTKSHESFRVAFAMFDQDDNGRIEKHEFLLARSLVSAIRSTRNADAEREKCMIDFSNLEQFIKRCGLKLRHESVHFEKSDEEVKMQDTTILLHLFGHHGDQSLSFDQFQMFYNNLQKEIMEIEFHEFSRGKTEISPIDFARLLLRYSIVNVNDYSKYINRVHERSGPDDRGVTLEEFEKFSLFLNNLEEFASAVRLYASAEMPVSQTEFVRAVKAATSIELDEHLVELVFRIFDANSDNSLSYSEFIAVMNDRLHRGLKSHSTKSRALNWASYRKCVVNELSRF